MEDSLLKSMVDLGGTVAVVGIFIWYLRDKNGKQETALNKVSDSLERNTKVLIKVAMKHKLMDEADHLIEE